jgi:hypothetical protein
LAAVSLIQSSIFFSVTSSEVKSVVKLEFVELELKIDAFRNGFLLLVVLSEVEFAALKISFKDRGPLVGVSGILRKKMNNEQICSKT